MHPEDSLLAATLALLEREGLPYERRRHPAGASTEELARLRGLPVSAGVKALLMKIRGELTLIALRSDRRTDNRTVRRALSSQKLRFARPEELEQYGLVPGRIPPIGPPLLPFRLVADRGVLEQDLVAFTAGTNTDSLLMPTRDWLSLARPELFDLAQPRPD